MDSLNINERYQETVNKDGAVFFVESSDNQKFHVYDKKTQALIGKTIVESDQELSESVNEIITFD